MAISRRSRATGQVEFKRSKPTFTQKHYVKLAEFFAYELRIALDIQGARVFPTTDDGTRVNTIRGLARLLANGPLHNDNPKFDARRFYAACGMKES